MVSIHAQAPHFNAVTPSIDRVSRFEKLELVIDLTAGFVNAYDYDDIIVQAVFTAPSGRRDTVEAFYAQDFDLNTVTGAASAKGTATFKIRYAPNEIGYWTYQLISTNSAGTSRFAGQTFQCESLGSKGFIRKNGSNYLGFDDLEQYIPIGENMGWANNNPYLDYQKWVGKLANAKGNFIRLWTPAWGLGLEWKTGNGYQGLKKYQQTNSFYLDWLMDYCAQKGVYVQFCINHHGQVSSTVNANWADSPYNAANGGPCANTWDFFTNETAKKLHKNKLRYILARWGYSRNILSWELFNEVDWTDNYDTHHLDVLHWHDEMTTYLKQHDVNKHLITTSFSNTSIDAATWKLTNVDYTQTHLYIGAANIETNLSALSADYLKTYAKPTLNGEFGLDYTGAASNDPTGTHIHNAVWATAFSGAMGAGMTWWWDNYVEPQNLYHHFTGLATFVASVPLMRGNYQAATATVSGASMASSLSLSPSLGWGNIAAADIVIDSNGVAAPNSMHLGTYLYGSTWNTQFRQPPTFHVSYGSAGKFTLTTGDAVATAPNITITVDGKVVLTKDAIAKTSYSVDITAGSHVIKVDNLGTDWASIGEYNFAGVAITPLDVMVMQAADKTSAAGWVHNKSYNWKYLKETGTPDAVKGASITLSDLDKRMSLVEVQWVDCSTGTTLSLTKTSAVNGVLTFNAPDIVWDAAFMVRSIIEPVSEVANVSFPFKVYPNPLSGGALQIAYELSGEEDVRVEAFRLDGVKVGTIFAGRQGAGVQEVSWDARGEGISSGVYLIAINMNGGIGVRKLVIL